MTIHELFTPEEQELISQGLEKLRTQAKAQAESPIRGHGKSTEYEKKKQWKNRMTDIEELQSKIVDLSI